ncbi:hypothetical protein BTN99_13635 [Vibrio campbellii]|nr:hypothetical protein BTN99_13635 [Vibrio campbellii]
MTLCSESGNKNIIVDMGLRKTYFEQIKPDLLKMAENNEKIDLLIITHIDQDHIQGSLSFFEENGNDSKIIEVKEVWHNSFRHLQFDKKDSLPDSESKILKKIISQNLTNTVDGKSDISAHEGSSLSALLLKNNYRWNYSTQGQAIHTCSKREYEFDNFKIDLLSPNRIKLDKLSKFWLGYLEDQKYNFTITDDTLFDDAFEFMTMNEVPNDVEKSDISKDRTLDFEMLSYTDAKSKDIDKRAPNGSSIAFILTFKGKKLLFLADAHDDIILDELKSKFPSKPPRFDLIKIPHHGSNNNYRRELSDFIKSDTYLISTDGEHHGHPNIEVIAKISNSLGFKKIIFNYEHDTYRKVNVKPIKEKYNVDFVVSNDFTIE